MTRSSSMKLVERHDLDVRVALLDLGRRGDPVHDRHQQVHQHDVGLELARRARPPAAPSSASPTISMSSRSSKKPRRPAPHDGVVVDEQHPDPRRGASPLRGTHRCPVHRREHSRQRTAADPAGRGASAVGRSAADSRSPPGGASPAPATSASPSADRRGARRRRAARSRRAVASRIDVNGIADLAEHLDRDEEAREQEHDAQELAQLEQLRRAGPVERVGEGREERADRDEDRRRDTRECSRPATRPRTAPGSDATRLTTIATGAMSRLNRNCVARLVADRASTAARAAWA